MNDKFPFALFFSFIVASVASGASILLVHRSVDVVRDPVPRSLAEARLADEESVAEALGFARVSEDTLRVSIEERRPAHLEAGECLAAIAGYFGGASSGGIVVVARGASRTGAAEPDALAEQFHTEGVVAHVQWCAERTIDLDVVVRARPEEQRGRIAPTDVVLRIMRAPASAGLTNARLVRGWVLLDPATVLNRAGEPASLE